MIVENIIPFSACKISLNTADKNIIGDTMYRLLLTNSNKKNDFQAHIWKLIFMRMHHHEHLLLPYQKGRSCS